MANNTISQVEINGTTYDLLDANTLSALDSLKTRVTTLESSVSIVKNNSTDNTYTWEIETLNNIDTWVPVMHGQKIQHKTVGQIRETNLQGTGIYANLKGSVWKVNNIGIFTYGGDGIEITNAMTGWQTIGMVPENFRPYRDTYFSGRQWSNAMSCGVLADGQIRAFLTAGTDQRLTLYNAVYIVLSVNV